MRCCIRATTLVTRTRHNGTLYVHCQSCYLRLASGGRRHGEESREHCLGHDWLETFIQNGFSGRPVVSLIVDEAHYTRYPKRTHRFPRLMYRTIDSCCRISCGMDCLSVDCAEQFGELCQEIVATETATERRDELLMLH